MRPQGDLTPDGSVQSLIASSSIRSIQPISTRQQNHTPPRRRSMSELEERPSLGRPTIQPPPSMYITQRTVDMLLLLAPIALGFLSTFLVRRRYGELAWEPVLDQRVNCYKWLVITILVIAYIAADRAYSASMPAGCDGFVCTQFYPSNGYRISVNEKHLFLFLTTAGAGYFYGRLSKYFTPIQTGTPGYLLKVAAHGKGEHSPHLEISWRVRRQQLKADPDVRRKLELEGFRIWMRCLGSWVSTLETGSTVEFISPILIGRDPSTLARWISRRRSIHSVTPITVRGGWCEGFLYNIKVNQRISFRPVVLEGIRFKVA
ncbi:Uncharacterised protein [Stenotrophomonas maltophilia]|nr:Uncharacterised protein [Stenotrophomonas maltophilia]